MARLRDSWRTSLSASQQPRNPPPEPIARNPYDWFFAFLDRFPTPGSITALSKEAFIAAAWSVVGRKVAKERLLGDIYETARASIGLPIPIDAPDRSGRGALPSPGRPSVARREDHRHFWAAIAAGRSSEDAAVGAGVSPAVGARWFRRAGGMPPSQLAPSSKSLSGRSLSFAEREEIAIWRAQRHGVREIARRLARAPSTISRELRRNAATRSGGLAYRATTAQWHADRSARRPKAAKLAINEPLRRYVQDRLAGLIIAPNGAAVHGPVVPWKGRRHGRRQDRRWATAWSPEQIARRLRLDFPDDETMRISHEALYQALYVQ